MQRLKEILLEAARKEARLDPDELRSEEEIDEEFKAWVSEPEAEIFFGCIQKWYDEKIEENKINSIEYQ